MVYSEPLADDYIDIRSVIKRFEELESEREELTDALAEPGASGGTDEAAALGSWDEDNGDELALLKSVLDDLAGNGGDEQWRGDYYPLTLIREACFENFAREEAESLYGREIGDARWPFNCIDWEKAAEELQSDYASIEIDGITYYYH